MTLSLVGDGPAADAVRAAIADTDHAVAERSPDEVAADDDAERRDPPEER